MDCDFRPRRSFPIFYTRCPRGSRRDINGHVEGRALDIGLLISDPNEKAIGDGLFDILVNRSHELGIDHIIWNGLIWSPTRGGPRRYTGHNPHVDHIHVAFTRDGSQRSQFPLTMFDICVLRQGLEEVAQGRARIA